MPGAELREEASLILGGREVWAHLIPSSVNFELYTSYIYICVFLLSSVSCDELSCTVS